MKDNLYIPWKGFLQERTADLFERFPGFYRAEVMETNDPLRHRRIRVKIPELHDHNVPVADLPWAVPAPWMGGKGTGLWHHVEIGDQVFVAFEKNHPYAPIWVGGANPTRRKMFNLFSLYGKPPVAVDPKGNPASDGPEIDERYFPADERPQNIGISDRYGTSLILSAVGFFPKEHAGAAADAGADGVTQGQFKASKKAPKSNDPDVKMFTVQTKYGHTFLLGDQGYDWQKEFKGDHESDRDFEVRRAIYLQNFWCEQQPSKRDQRRIEVRTRYGHKFEMRDVGWERARSGEYKDGSQIADSQGRDERWVKLRSKAGMIFQAIDTGAHPVADNFIKKLNSNEFGDNTDNELALGEDRRVIRSITRHGAMFYLDDRGSSPTNADTAETPRGNGSLWRTRRGHQWQMVDKDSVNSVMLSTAGDQVMEFNDKHNYIICSTKQSGPVHRTIAKPTVAPPYFTVTGQTNDPEANTFHWKLDKANKYARFKTPEGQGIEMRDGGAPCGTWTELRDNEGRGFWMSKTDNHAIWRDKTGGKYIWFDDQEDTIVIRNTNKVIQIFAAANVEVIAGQKVCITAGQEIGLKAGKKIAFEAGGCHFVMDGRGFGTERHLQCATMSGQHTVLQIPAHPVGPAPRDPRGAVPCSAKPKQARRLSPKPFDTEIGCDPIKSQKGPIPESIFSGPPGSGGGGSGSGNGGGGGNGGGSPPPIGSEGPNDPPAPSSQAPTEVTIGPNPTPDPITDPVDTIVNPPQPGTNPPPGGSGGVLWYGTSTIFLEEIEEFGLVLTSLANNQNVPSNLTATHIKLAKSFSVAQGEKQALLAQERYGGRTLVLRIRSVPDGTLLTQDSDQTLADYAGTIPFEGNIEVYEVGQDELTKLPLFPNI